MSDRTVVIDVNARDTDTLVLPPSWGELFAGRTRRAVADERARLLRELTSPAPLTAAADAWWSSPNIGDDEARIRDAIHAAARAASLLAPGGEGDVNNGPDQGLVLTQGDGSVNSATGNAADNERLQQLAVAAGSETRHDVEVWSECHDDGVHWSSRVGSTDHGGGVAASHADALRDASAHMRDLPFPVPASSEVLGDA